MQAISDPRTLALVDEWTALRRHLHQHPELGFAEHTTARITAQYLRNAGYDVYEGVAGTGVVGLLQGAFPGKTIALRACLDALPIQECTDVAYASQNPGCMHACGHDGNMTVTLGAAKRLAEARAQLHGNVKIILQPSEENTGGAAAMIEAGVLDSPTVDAIITPHIWHDISIGTICIPAGPVMAGSDLFQLDVHGVAGHGAWPHLAVDPLPVAAEILLALQKIISREVTRCLAPVSPSVKCTMARLPISYPKPSPCMVRYAPRIHSYAIISKHACAISSMVSHVPAGAATPLTINASCRHYTMIHAWLIRL